MTRVLNLATGKSQWFSLPPIQAVVCAYRQDRHDWNTWAYDFTQFVLGKSGRTVFCGDFGALLERAGST